MKIFIYLQKNNLFVLIILLLLMVWVPEINVFDNSHLQKTPQINTKVTRSKETEDTDGQSIERKWWERLSCGTNSFGPPL